MVKRRKKSYFTPETLGISILVLIFFIWAMYKFGLGSKVSSWMAADDIAQDTIAVVDSFQMQLDELRPIYVTIDDLNMRTEPTLKSSVLKKLPLHERVYFTGVISDTTMRINIGLIMANEPWVKVIDEEGTEGWLYGAGVQFYKTTNPNALGRN